MTAFKDSDKGTKTAADRLLQTVRDDTIVFRAVRNNPPTEDDFVSYAVEGHRPRLFGGRVRSAGWFGVSMYDRPDAVERFVKLRAAKGESYYVAELLLPGGQGTEITYRAKNGHMDVFGFPERLAVCFRRALK